MDIPDHAPLSVYAYEVDGLGNAVTDFDDPNLPSLMAMPLLGYSGYDEKVYLTTRARWVAAAGYSWCSCCWGCWGW